MELLELELANIIKVLAGGRYTLVSPRGRTKSVLGGDDARAEFLQQTIARFIKSCRANQQTISRKHLQLHLFDFDCVLNKERWAGGKLLDAFLSHEPIEYEDIVKYSSPMVLQFADDSIVNS